MMSIRDDQLKTLDDLAEQTMDAFLEASDPREWTGHGKPMSSMDPQTRGARNWDIKTSNQIGALAARVLDLRDRLSGKGVSVTTAMTDDDAEDNIKRYERQAREAMKKAGIAFGPR
jgi:hypothetical protein